MKVNEIILTEEQEIILEFKLKHAIAASALGASLLGNPTKTHSIEPQQVQQTQVQQPTQHVLPVPKKQIDPKQQKAAELIASKYKVDLNDALDIVQLAHKYEKQNFPKAKDLLAIIGIESSFNPDAISGLKRDPAVGLTQVRPKVWGLDPESLKDPEIAIKAGADILHLYYRKLHNKQAAVAAYNVGWGEYRNGNTADGYVSKYKHELKDYSKI